MKVRRGAIPTFLGTAVTATGAALTAMEIAPLVAAGAIGFGLAHIVLGGMEMSRTKNNRKKTMQ
ncbi:asparagine synthase [Clostridium sp. WILCCON 0269]|uniref:Asparagine synthase n=1 Tax=Candidatus Clostridium eludens TaxID=3381663 RepID=A0ABW8SNE6_9CLOT